MIPTQALSMKLMQNKPAYWKNLMNLYPNMTRFTQNCSSLKALIPIFSTGLFNWSAKLLRTLSTAEKKQMK